MAKFLLESDLLFQDVGLIIGSMGVAGFLIWMMTRKSSESSSSPSERNIVPFATYNAISDIRGMTSSHPHLYLHHLSQKCQRKVFRLALPIFQLREISIFGKGRRFYIPIPVLRKVFVVGDVQLARCILQDSTSDKPCEIFKSFEGITFGKPVMFTSRNSPYTKSIRRTAHRAFSLKTKNSSSVETKVSISTGDEQLGKRMRLITQKHIDQWLTGRLKDFSESQESFDPVDEALAVTFYIICEAAFHYQASFKEFRMFTDNLDSALHEFAYKQSTNPLRKIFGFLLPGVWKAKRSAQKVMHFAEHMVETHESDEILKSMHKNEHDSKTFLDFLFENSHLQGDRNQLISEIVMFMAAGHETTGSMISNIMIQLATHPDVQEKLRKSLPLPQENENQTSQYYKNVLRETNRVFPVAVMGSTRLTGRKFVVPGDGTHIPANSICFLPQYLYYQDVDIFEDAEKFDPDRWDPNVITEDMNDAARMAFSHGPRSCPGKPLAVEEMNRLLPRLVQRFSLHLDSESQSDYRVILKHSGARLKVRQLQDNTPGTYERSTAQKLKLREKKSDSISLAPVATRLYWKILCTLFFFCAGTMVWTRFVLKPRQTCSNPKLKSLNVTVLTEPSPIGSYICGQSKRIEFLMQYLVEHTNDSVELITAEVHDKIRPSLWRDSVRVHYTHGVRLPSYNQISISFDWTAKAFRELYNFKPNLIHVTTPGPLLFPSVIASRVWGIPIVMSCHTHLTAYAKTYLPAGINIIAEWFLWRYTAAVHSFADVTLVTSPQIQRDFTRHGIPRVEVWQKGVNSTQFHPDYNDADMRYRMTDGRPDDFLLVYIGRLAEEKRLVVLKDVIEKIPNATLCFVGTGPFESKLREYFKGTQTIFMGQLRGLELSQAFASGDVFCMPSTSETLGFVVLESMASGVPVVAAKAGGLQHLIDHQRTGFLVTPENENEFIQKIETIRATPLLRKSIVDSARLETEMLTWERSMANVRDFIYPTAIQNFQQRSWQNDPC